MKPVALPLPPLFTLSTPPMATKPGRFGMFIQWLVVALALVGAPAFADEYADVGQLLRSGKLAEAMVKADAYLGTNPRDPQMRFLKGVIQRDSGKLPEAIATFTKLTEDYPELPEPYNNLAVLYAGQSQFDKARAALEMAIRTNPSYATAHENLGDVYAKLASQAYNKALQLDSANAAVPPKLALIRELFNPSARGQRPAASVAPAAATPLAAAAPPAPAKPAVVAAAVPAATPAVPPAATAPAAATAPLAAAAAVTAPARPGASAASAAPNNSPNAAAKDAKDAEIAVRAWAAAWSSKDMSAYLGAYGKEFTPPGNQPRRAWEDDRRARITGKASISVKLENLTVAVSGAKAVAKFRQDYKASGLAVSSRKTLDLVKTGSTWLIARESTGA
jgi:tetratricopeptide (TPR) repeat protein